MSQDGMPCQSQAREGCGFVEDGRCGAMLLRQLQCIGRTMLWCKTVCIIWASSAEVEQWATARRRNATEQWGAIRGREVMNARLADGDTGGRYGRAKA